MTTPIEWAIVVPFGAALAAVLLGRRLGTVLGIGTSFVLVAIAVWLAARVWVDGTIDYQVGGWDPPLGIRLHADGLSALMMLMAATVSAPVAMYAPRYFHAEETSKGWSEHRAYLPLWLMLLGSLNVLFLSGDIFNLYVALELLTLAGVGLVVVAGSRDAMVASMRYLLAMFFASILYLVGVALLYAQFDTLDIVLLGARFESSGPGAVAFGFIIAGLAIKSALFPFHAWLPGAHGSAPAPVSAALSALVVQGAFYMMLRLWTDVLGTGATPPVAAIMGVLGAAGIVWGSLHALRDENLKLVVAHSTVSQVGYLFLVFPLMTTGPGMWQIDAWSGVVYQVVSHAFAKSALFLCVGTILYAYGSDRISDLRGIGASLPMTTFAFGIAGVSLIGLPPSGSFVAKWLLISASIESGQWWWVIVIGVGTLLSGAYVFRLARVSVSSDERNEPTRPAPRAMELPCLALALVALVVGLRAGEFLELMSIGAPFQLINAGAL